VITPLRIYLDFARFVLLSCFFFVFIVLLCSVYPDPRGNSLGRGTEITMFLKEDADEFLSQDTLKDLINRYSEFITFPIYLHTSHEEEVEVPDESEEEEVAQEGEEGGDEEGGEDDEVEVEEEVDEKKEKTVTESVTVWDWERVNDNVAIWARNKEDVTDEEYNNFFKSLDKVRFSALLPAVC
jgi:heat shock protein beta